MPPFTSFADPPFPQQTFWVAMCGQTAADSDMVTIDSLWELTNALSNGTIADPLRIPSCSTKIGVPTPSAESGKRSAWTPQHKLLSLPPYHPRTFSLPFPFPSPVSL